MSDVPTPVSTALALAALGDPRPPSVCGWRHPWMVVHAATAGRAQLAAKKAHEKATRPTAAIDALLPPGGPPSVHSDIDAQQAWYAATNYSMVGVLNDAFCLGWRGSTLAWLFSCAWSLEVMLLSMREQLSFHHSMPEGLALFWASYEEVAGCQPDGCGVTPSQLVSRADAKPKRSFLSSLFGSPDREAADREAADREAARAAAEHYPQVASKPARSERGERGAGTGTRKALEGGDGARLAAKPKRRRKEQQAEGLYGTSARGVPARPATWTADDNADFHAWVERQNCTLSGCHPL